MKILVTGGSGFLGQNLVRRLAAERLPVRATHRSHDAVPLAGVEWWPLASLTDRSRLEESIEGCDMVVHLAALAHQSSAAAGAADFRLVNTEGTRLLARAAARCGVRRFIFMSSIAAVCSRSGALVDDQTRCAPTDDYGRSKLEAERALVSELEASTADWCVLRPPLIYGPANPGNMRRLLRLMNTGLPLPFGSIRNRRSFMYVDNLVDAIVRVLRHAGEVRSTFVVSDDSDFSTPGLVKALAAAADRRERLLPMPESALVLLGRGFDLIRRFSGVSLGIGSAEVDRLVGSLPIDGSRFQRYFDWRAPVPPELAFRQMGDYLRRFGRHL